jgi:hypothetical protein
MSRPWLPVAAVVRYGLQAQRSVLLHWLCISYGFVRQFVLNAYAISPHVGGARSAFQNLSRSSRSRIATARAKMSDEDGLHVETPQQQRATTIPSWQLMEAADRVVAEARAAVRRTDPIACIAVQVTKYLCTLPPLSALTSNKQNITICCFVNSTLSSFWVLQPLLRTLEAEAATQHIPRELIHSRLLIWLSSTRRQSVSNDGSTARAVFALHCCNLLPLSVLLQSGVYTAQQLVAQLQQLAAQSPVTLAHTTRHLLDFAAAGDNAAASVAQSVLSALCCGCDYTAQGAAGTAARSACTTALQAVQHSSEFMSEQLQLLLLSSNTALTTACNSSTSATSTPLNNETAQQVQQFFAAVGCLWEPVELIGAIGALLRKAARTANATANWSLLRLLCAAVSALPRVAQKLLELATALTTEVHTVVTAIVMQAKHKVLQLCQRDVQLFCASRAHCYCVYSLH